jgi:cell division septation protein DedD
MNQKKSSDKLKQHPGKRKRKELLSKIALYTIVCLWMFALGFLVGRGTAPVRFNIERLQDVLADLKAADTEETIQRYEIAFEGLDKGKDLGFPEALTGEETDLGQAVLPTVEISTPEAPSETTETIAPEITRDSDFQEPPAVETRKEWTIQVAATQDKSPGDQLVARLKKMGYSAYLKKTVIPDKGTWYRIRVGGYASEKAAGADLARLKKELKKERFSPFIVPPQD